MEIYVEYKEGDDLVAHWRKQVTLPKKWLTSPSDRLKRYLVENYNKDRAEGIVALEHAAVHLSSNAASGGCKALGSEDILEQVVDRFDTLSLRQGAAEERSGWQRAEARSCEVATSQVLVPIDYTVLLALRSAVDSDNTEAVRSAVDEANIASPHDLVMAEADMLDDEGQVCGTEWHTVAGRFAWDSATCGRGEDPEKKLSLIEYARRQNAGRVLKLIDIAEHCGAPVLGGGRQRTVEDIESSAGSVQGTMGRMNAELRAHLEGKDRT